MSRRLSRPLEVCVVALALAFALSLALSAPSSAMAASITVDWDVDGKGFEVTSDQALSNVIVEDCFGMTHKHEAEFNGTSKVWYHDESFPIVGIWVKSGDNSDPDGPSGAGERFDNPNVNCEGSTGDGPPSGECPADMQDMLVDHKVFVTRGDVTMEVDSLAYTRPGDLVAVDVLVAQGCEEVLISLVSYETSGNTMSTAVPYTFVDHSNGTFDEGWGSLTNVTLPACFYEVDLVFGDVLGGDGMAPGAYGDDLIAGHLNGDVCLEDEPCLGVTLLSAQATEVGNELTWEAVADASGYTVHRTTLGIFEEIAIVDADATSYVDSDVQAGMVYSYRVTAVFEDAESGACNEMTLTAIPFFPGYVAMSLAAVGALGIYAGGRYLVRRHG